MTDENCSINQTNIAEKSYEIEIYSDNNKEQPFDKLIEPIASANIEKSVESNQSLFTKFVGIIYILLSAIIFTGSLFITKQLQIDVLDALIPCYIVHAITLTIYSKCIKNYSFYEQSTKQEIFFLFINIFFSTTGVFTFYFAYRYLPLPDLITIRYTQVIWTAIITTIIYRERPSLPIILAVLLTTIGVACVAQPTFLFNKSLNKSANQNHSLIGIFIALYSAIALSIMIISNRHLLLIFKTKNCSIMLHYAVVTLCVLIGKVIYQYKIFTEGMEAFKNYFLTLNYLYASLVCLFHIIAIILTQKAIKREHPAIFTVVQSSNILFSLMLQNVFSSVKSNVLSLVGSMLVLISIVIITGWKFFKEKKAK